MPHLFFSAWDSGQSDVYVFSHGSNPADPSLTPQPQAWSISFIGNLSGDAAAAAAHAICLVYKKHSPKLDSHSRPLGIRYTTMEVIGRVTFGSRACMKLREHFYELLPNNNQRKMLEYLTVCLWNHLHIHLLKCQSISSFVFSSFSFGLT